MVLQISLTGLSNSGICHESWYLLHALPHRKRVKPFLYSKNWTQKCKFLEQCGDLVVCKPVCSCKYLRRFLKFIFELIHSQMLIYVYTELYRKNCLAISLIGNSFPLLVVMLCLKSFFEDLFASFWISFLLFFVQFGFGRPHVRYV